MPRITESITINVPVEKVFEYISNPENMTEWWSNVTAIRDITGHGELQSWTFDYKMMGLHFTSKAKVTRSRINGERRVESKGGMNASWFWEFRRVDVGTELRWVIDYTIPIPVLGKVSELLILRRNERVASFALTNIKERMEA
ncbi:MAG: SRPBCC family protein [Dehalococcoidales bacterium]|nr:SRPBCC family protein [Dehalococcoidales bacterium]